MEKNDHFWIIGGGLLQIPLIDEAKALGFKTIVSDLSPKCACRNSCDIFVECDIFDIEAHIVEADRLVGEGVKIAGVLAAGIDAPETMAGLAEHLKLPTVKREIARLVHNKYDFRGKLRELGYPTPKFERVSAKDIARLEEIVDNFGFPLIVKNTDSSGSRGTKIFREKDIPEITRVVNEAIKVSKSATALLEECWEGPEQTVETIFDINGKFHRCFITDRIFDRSSGYAMEIALRQPSALPESTQEEMYKISEAVANDLGVTIGAAKFDFILTKDGPRIIEMTVRLSGGFDCQYLVPAATGKNIMKAAILTALGKEIPEVLLIDTKHRVGLSESVWPEPGKLVEISGLEETLSIPGVEKIFFRYSVGDTVLPYVDCTRRVCFIIVTGKDEAEAREVMEKAKRTLKVITK